MTAKEADWDTLVSLFDESEGNFDEILEFSNGLKYLKLQTISKKDRLKQIAEKYNIQYTSSLKVKELSKKIFDTLSENQIEDFIREQYNSERVIARGAEDELIEQLKKIKNNDWGNTYKNKIEFHITDNYVKIINNYDTMKQRLDTEIREATEGWALTSWYNFWSNELIENHINDHPKVLPGIGKIKNIDFFWDNLPFDVKTTFFARGFLEKKRGELNLTKKEFSAMKKFARQNRIDFDNDGTKKEIERQLISKLSSENNTSKKFLKEQIYDIRRQILHDAISDPTEYVTWLFKEQSDKRFGNENRLFVILVDKDISSDSWKLKIKKDVWAEKLNNFLDEGPESNMLRDIHFEYENNDYTANCSILFIVEE